MIPSFMMSQTNLNMALFDSLDYATGVNDVVGWVDDEGREYAIVGLTTGVSIVSVDENPVEEVVFVPGVNNLWRDINTFGHYAYVVSEAKVGLIIIDLQFLPDSVQTYVWMDSIPTPSGKVPFEKAHTIWVDEYGIGYLNGSNLNAGGVVLIDIASSPTDPKYLGSAPPIYSHDSYSRDSILYSAEIYAGEVSIYDVHNPQNIQLIGRVKTPNEFTHNAWLSDNGEVMFTTDERGNSYVASYDIRDPGNIIELDRFRQAATDGTGNIPHNVYVWNDWLVVAYYTSGTLIVDASRPGNLIEVGSFDSFLGVNGGFSGVWGSYPFLPSGKILSSDRSSGLFVFIPNYVRAAHIEAIVLDSVTLMPINGAVARIESSEVILPQITGLDGTFKTGKAIPGTYLVRVTKQGYYPEVIPFEFINGQLLTPTFLMSPLPIYSFSGTVINSLGQEVENAEVTVTGQEGTYNAVTNASGQFLLPAVFGGAYHVQAGVWGKVVETDILLVGSQDVTLQLQNQYYDDFDLDLGWVVSGDANEGQWVRGIPSRQILFDTWECSSDGDSPFDQGQNTYSTGLSPTLIVNNDEVSGGTTWLTSPPMDLDSISIAQISFDYWLCEFPINKYVGLQVWLTDQIDTVLISEITNDSIFGYWQTFFADVAISDWQNSKDSFHVLFSASDTTPGPNEYYLKVHIDRFQLVEGGLAVDDVIGSKKHLTVFPNPANTSTIWIKDDSNLEGQVFILKLYDSFGRQISTSEIHKSEFEKGLNLNLQDGIYFLHWITDKEESGIEKIVVLKK